MTTSWGHNDHVKTQRERDEQTVTIATALAVFIATLAIGIAGIVVVGAMTDMSQTFDAAIYWTVSVAVLAGGTYLVRHHM